MPGTVDKCPFSKIECRDCPIFRGRHNYIVSKEGEETPSGRVLRQEKDDKDWLEKFKEALHQK
ncbi:MAG: hypothetical protein ABSC19_03790 [Syntrophorhabdales bacterium]|jgi:hypothetical protein